MITSEKFWHDNQVPNQWGKKGELLSLGCSFQESKKYSDFPISRLIFAFKEQLLQYLGQKLRRFSLWKIFCDVDKMVIKTPLFYKISNTLKNSWLPAW